ncbi:DUF7537 family lipoprotein [Halobaculum gomorrense]|uniref:Uncharacterized protein n=1 Tax=Halobaculum gomorrense TaxID=43928 RepID=A0A1M5MI32_9EURY|nr:hypothetical protein [Halobaculum gomorrense]SHG76871.1 hypothetical protein SAMN05443636_1019 [Halobaculum gomorrense]
MHRAAAALVLAVAVVLAGCGAAPGGGAGGRTVNPALANTPTASPTPTPEPDYPPGVAVTGVDVATLATAHDRALRGVNSTVRFRRTVTAANGTVLSTRRSVTESAGDRLGFDYVQRGSPPGETTPPIRAFAFWTNGSVTALRTVDDDGAVSYQVVPGQPPAVASVDDSGEGVLFAAFDGTNLRLSDTISVGAERLYVLSARHDRLARSGRRPIEDVSVVAYVTDDGVVGEYELRYVATYGSGDGRVTARTVERFRVTTNDTAAAPPAWIDEARRSDNRSDG